jgi:hypothetical protein
MKKDVADGFLARSFRVRAWKARNPLHRLRAVKSEGYAASPRNQTTSCYTAAWDPSSLEPLRRTWAKNPPSCSATFLWSSPITCV